MREKGSKDMNEGTACACVDECVGASVIARARVCVSKNTYHSRPEAPLQASSRVL